MNESKKIGNKQNTSRVPEEIEFKEIKPTKKPVLPTSPEGISHTSTKDSGNKEKTVDGNSPMIPTPVAIGKEEADQIHAKLEQKFTRPSTFNELLEHIKEGSLDVQTRVKKATEKINNVAKSELDFEAKTFQIQLILLETMNLSLDIGGEYGKMLGLQQADQKKEQFDLLLKQQEAEKKAARTSLISKIFGWIGDIVNLIFAAVAVVATAIAAVGTAGASAGMIAGAVAWMAGAILGVAARGCEESGILKGTNVEWLGIAMTFAGIGLSLGGMGLGGASGALKTGEMASQMIVKLVKYAETAASLFKVATETSAKITGYVHKYEIEGIRAEKVDSDKMRNQLEFAYNSMLRGQQDILKSLQELSDKISSGYAQKTRSISATLGNII